MNHFKDFGHPKSVSNILSRTKNVPFWQQKSRLANAELQRDIFVAFHTFVLECSKSNAQCKALYERILRVLVFKTRPATNPTELQNPNRPNRGKKWNK